MFVCFFFATVTFGRFIIFLVFYTIDARFLLLLCICDFFVILSQAYEKYAAKFMVRGTSYGAILFCILSDYLSKTIKILYNFFNFLEIILTHAGVRFKYNTSIYEPANQITHVIGYYGKCAFYNILSFPRFVR